MHSVLKTTVSDLRPGQGWRACSILPMKQPKRRASVLKLCFNYVFKRPAHCIEIIFCGPFQAIRLQRPHYICPIGLFATATCAIQVVNQQEFRD